MKISVFINTFNEENNIKNCLETIKWADEIIVVDMHSDDKTVEIAREYTDKIYYFERCGYADPARKFALSKCTNDWVFFIDADEIAPLKLKNELFKIAEEDFFDAVFIPRVNYFFGDKLDIEISFYNKFDFQLRFFKKSKVVFSDEIHNFIRLGDDCNVYRIKNFDEGIIHLSDNDFNEWFEKIDKYTSIEANNIIDGLKTKSSLKKNFTFFYFITLKELIISFLTNRNIQNLMYSVSMLNYYVISYSKLKLFSKYNSNNVSKEIKKDYNSIANEYIFEYEKFSNK